MSPLLTKRDIASRLRVSTRTVSRLMSARQIAFLRIAGVGVRFTEAQLADFERHQVEVIPRASLRVARMRDRA